MPRFIPIKSEPVVRAHEIVRTFQLGEHTHYALQGINLVVERNDFLAIAGPSGSGKTTLLNILGCIDRPSEGEIFVEGIPVRFLSHDALANFRAQKIGFVFQTFNLIPTLTALENVEYPLLMLNVPAKERQERARAILSRVGLDRFEKNKPNQLSGGQRQRVAIARAVVKNPSLVLADEPTANLDKKTANEVLDLMQSLHQDNKTTFVFSSHDPLVLARTRRIFNISQGKAEETIGELSVA